MSNQQIDISVVLKKLQDRLAESMTTIAVLEAQIEMMESHQHTHDEAPSEE